MLPRGVACPYSKLRPSASGEPQGKPTCEARLYSGWGHDASGAQLPEGKLRPTIRLSGPTA